MYSALQSTPWARHAKLVLLTRHGRPINAMNADLWQPISNLSLQSWADFSSRLPEGQASLSWRWGGGGG